MSRPVKRHVRQGPEGSRARALLSPWTRGGQRPGTSICSSIQKLSEANVGGLGRLHHVGVIEHQLSLQPVSPSQRRGSGTENSKLLIMCWWPARILEPARDPASHLIRTRQ